MDGCFHVLSSILRCYVWLDVKVLLNESSGMVAYNVLGQ